MKAQRKEDMDDKDEVEEYDKVLHDEGNEHENYSRVCSTSATHQTKMIS